MNGAVDASSAAVVFEVDGRPAPAPRAPPRDALREVYVELLAIERERLAVAVRIERERGFVFPETSVIVRDVRTLAEKVYGSTSTENTPAGGREVVAEVPAHERASASDDPSAGDVDALLASLAHEGEP